MRTNYFYFEGQLLRLIRPFVKIHSNETHVSSWTSKGSIWGGHDNACMKHSKMGRKQIWRPQTTVQAVISQTERQGLPTLSHSQKMHERMYTMQMSTHTHKIKHSSFTAPAQANARRNAEVRDHHQAFALFIRKVELEADLHAQHKHTRPFLHIYKHTRV